MIVHTKFQYCIIHDLDQLNEDIDIHKPSKPIKTLHHSDVENIMDRTIVGLHRKIKEFQHQHSYYIIFKRS